MGKAPRLRLIKRKDWMLKAIRSDQNLEWTGNTHRWYEWVDGGLFDTPVCKCLARKCVTLDMLILHENTAQYLAEIGVRDMCQRFRANTTIQTLRTNEKVMRSATSHRERDQAEAAKPVATAAAFPPMPTPRRHHAAAAIMASAGAGASSDDDAPQSPPRQRRRMADGSVQIGANHDDYCSLCKWEHGGEPEWASGRYRCTHCGTAHSACTNCVDGLSTSSMTHLDMFACRTCNDDRADWEKLVPACLAAAAKPANKPPMQQPIVKVDDYERPEQAEPEEFDADRWAEHE